MLTGPGIYLDKYQLGCIFKKKTSLLYQIITDARTLAWDSSLFSIHNRRSVHTFPFIGFGRGDQVLYCKLDGIPFTLCVPVKIMNDKPGDQS